MFFKLKGLIILFVTGVVVVWVDGAVMVGMTVINSTHALSSIKHILITIPLQFYMFSDPVFTSTFQRLHMNEVDIFLTPIDSTHRPPHPAPK